MMKSSNEICQTSVPRTTVEVHLPDGRILCGPRNRPIAAFLKGLPEWNQHDPIMGAVVNGELRELTHPVKLDSRVRLVTMSDPDGSGIYRRSVTFLLEAAFESVFPTADISIDHSLSSGGFYCSVINRGPLSKEELTAVEARMKELVKADLPFERTVVPLQDAISYFQSKGQDEKVQLLKFRSKDTLVLYKLGDRCDLLAVRFGRAGRSAGGWSGGSETAVSLRVFAAWRHCHRHRRWLRPPRPGKLRRAILALAGPHPQRLCHHRSMFGNSPPGLLRTRRLRSP